MKKYKCLNVLVALFFLIETLGFAQNGFDQNDMGSNNSFENQQNTSLGKEQKSDLISLELKNIDAVEVIKILSRKGKINVIIGNNVRGRITMFLNDIKIRDALLAVFESTQLAYVEENGIMKIMPTNEYETIYGRQFYDKKTLTVIPLQNAVATEVASAITKLSPKSIIIIDDRTNSLLIKETDSNIAIIKNAILQMDKKIVSENYKVKYLTQKQIEDLMKIVLSKKGVFYFNAKINQVIIQDFPENVQKIITLLKSHDIKTQIITKIYELDYAKFDIIEAKLKTIITPEIGSVVSDERTNKILVSDLEVNFLKIDKLITAYDRKDREVLIEAKIVQVLLNDTFQWGINWQTVIKQINNSNIGLKIMDAYDFSGNVASGTEFAQSIDAINAVPGLLKAGSDDTTTTITTDKSEDGISKPTSTTKTSIQRTIKTTDEVVPVDATKITPFNNNIVYPSDGGARIVALGTLGGNQFEGVLNALKMVGNTKVLSSPRIITLNNEPAKIHVGTKQAYATSTTVSPGTGPVTSAENVTFIDVGISLEVTPIINKENYITMKVKPSVSSVNSSVKTSSGNSIPIVSTQEVESKIQVKDGTTIVLGGLHEQTNDKEQRRLPFLGAIPIIGLLFKKINNVAKNSELVMFLTPHIMTGDKSFYEEIDKKFVSNNITDFLKEQKVYEKAYEHETKKNDIKK